MPASGRSRTLVPGRAEGTALVLAEGLSFWGGVDAASGRIVDVRHPQRGVLVTGRVLVMPSGRGSSSSSTVLAESLRAGAGPAAVVLRDADPIVALGALVAGEIYGVACPVVVLEPRLYDSIGPETTLLVDATGEPPRVTARRGRERRGGAP